MQRIALYATLGYLLDVLGHRWNEWGFWCIVALFWALDVVARLELVELINAEVNALLKDNKHD